MTSKGRTITDLPQYTGNLGDGDVFEVSKDCTNGRFQSKKLLYGQLSQNVASNTIDKIQTLWNINESTPINGTVEYVQDLSARVLLTDEETVKFTKPPVLESESTDEMSVQNRKQVIELVGRHTNYVSPDSHISIDPKNDSGYTAEYQYMWKIDNGRYDSSQSIDEYGFPVDPVMIKKTGYLTIYGWLSSSKVVEPQNAWVGLYGNIVTSSGVQKWVLLQLQPWIMGANASSMQYVGFNIPVRANMQLKIMTGFPVNGNTSGFQKNDGHSLLMTRIGNVPNTFVGYVIET